MTSARTFAKAAALAALAVATMVPATSSAHPGPAHTINGWGMAGIDPVTVIGADQMLDTGTVMVGSTTITLSCVEVIASGPTTHLVGMFGTGGFTKWTITIRQSAAGDYLIVNNLPIATPTNANMCGIGNVGATGTGLFAVV
ncbi:MAG TPA: hypothetical protein VGB64_09330 [Actinomycetota bacterium]